MPDPDAEDDVAIRHITFWRDGFTVDEGDLYRFDDPANQQILAELDAGRAPPQILNIQMGQHVELRIQKRTHEDYQPPAGGRPAFSGAGNRLGAPVSAAQAPMPGSLPPASSERQNINTLFEVDQSQPTTSIQVRLADGTRMVARMNLTHTVQDLRNFINASRPENSTRPYTIGTTFPNRTLEDDKQNIKEAGLVNSVVVQRWV